MNKKIIFILMSFFVLNSIDTFGMKPSKKRKGAPSQETPPAKRIKKTKKPYALVSVSGYLMVIPQKYYGGRPVVKKKEGTEQEYFQGELIDLTQKDVIAHDSIFNLAQEKHKQGLPYILSLVTVAESEHVFARRYQDAEFLVPWMFNINNFSRLPNRDKHPLTQQRIAGPIHFYVWYPGTKEALYLAQDFDIRGIANDEFEDPEKMFIQRLLRVNADKGDINDLFGLGNYFEGKDKKEDLAILYYKMAEKKGDAEAAWKLGLLYEGQKNYDLAETYYGKAAQKQDVDAVLDLMYLFATNKTKQITMQQLKDYFQKIQDKTEDINHYKDNYPEQWDAIEQKFGTYVNQ